MKLSITVFVVFLFTTAYCQNYTSYITGSGTDVVTNPTGGICLMGGATEDDRAMTWFLERADGGDVLVIRASGSDGYNDYLYSELGVDVNSVETIVFHNGLASDDDYVLDKIFKAEAIWLAGGDQWNYVSYWRNTAVDSIINSRIENNNIVIGGTSAGMAVMGKYYFSAQNGSMTSAEGLENPYNNYATVDSTDFFHNDILHDVITDTHFDDPDRKGRMVTFLARIFTDYGVVGKGIACDEYTAVCIDTDGMARVFGEYPDSDDNAYFIQPNCELADMSPEQCSFGIPLTWNRDNMGLKVYKIKGTWDGVGNSFDLNNWTEGTGGAWENWWAVNGVFNEAMGDAMDCNGVAVLENSDDNSIVIYPNPAQDALYIECNNEMITQLTITATDGRIVYSTTALNVNFAEVDLNRLEQGIYVAVIKTQRSVVQRKFIRN